MSDLPVFGAGIWHFATYKDRYATDGYGAAGRPARADRPGRRRRRPVRGRPQLAVRRFDGTLDDVKAALERNGLRAVGDHPGDLQPRLRQGLDHQPGPGRPRAGA